MVRRSTNFRGIVEQFFILAVLSVVINGCGGSESSDKDLQGIKNGPGTLAATTNQSKVSNIKEMGSDGSPSGVMKNHENSPALNSFLKNVLRARDELKWIDQAVHRVGTEEAAQGNLKELDTGNELSGFLSSPRYSRDSFAETVSRYRPETRPKRRSGTELDEFESWPFTKRKYHDDGNAGSRRQSVHLEEEEGSKGEENEEMKVKRYANPSDFDGEPLSRNSDRKQGRSNLDYRSSPAVDDSTFKRWARDEGLDVPGSWFEYEGRQRSGGRVNRMDDSSRSSEHRVENPRRGGDRLAVAGSRENNPVDSVSEQPTLESLKRTVLELSKSLAASDREMEELNERSARSRERHVEDLAGREESRTKGEHERAVPNYMGGKNGGRNAIGTETSDSDSSALSSNWWEDPRPAAEMFDFKRRDDDETDEEDDAEGSESGNSESDYMMQRAKREGDGARVKVYRRAGFGESYPEVGEREESRERRKRSGSEKDPGEKAIAKNSERDVRDAVRLGSYEAGVGEIRGAGGSDKIINVENSDGEAGSRARIAEVNANENEHDSGGEDKEMKKGKEAERNGGGYNPVEKGAEGGTVGDSNLEDVKTASLSADEKRSRSLRGREEEHGQRLSVPAVGGTPLGEYSSNSIKSRLDGLLKNAAIEPPGVKIANEKYRQGIQGEKIADMSVRGVEETSERIGDEVPNKLSEDSNESKRDEETGRKNILDESRVEENFTDHIARGSEELKKSENEETNVAKREMIKEEESNGEENSKPEEQINLDGKNKSESAGKFAADSKLREEYNRPETSLDKGKSNPEEHEQPNDRDTSKIVELIEPRSESDGKLSSDNEIEARYEGNKFKDEHGSCDEEKRLISYSGKDNAKRRTTSSNDLNGQAEVGEEKGGKSEAKDANTKREEPTRKLLWLSSGGSESYGSISGIRDGRRDSAWDQKDGEKTGQQPANFFKNSPEGVQFTKRSLMMAGNRGSVNNAVNKRGRRRKVTRKGAKRSVKTYPENMEDDNAMEEVAREDKEDVHRSEARKRSLKKFTERRREPYTAEELYGVKYEGLGRNEEAIEDSEDSNKEEENASMESETQAESSPLAGSSSHKDGDRDPIRDKINMLIKQKLDDRSKEKQVHLKREVGLNAGNIEYYDYEGDVNSGESEVGRRASENEQPQNVMNQETCTTSTRESASIDSSEPAMKKDDMAEEERRQTLEHEELSNGPREEFIPNNDAMTTQKSLSQDGDVSMGDESSEGDQNRTKDEEMKDILRGAESSDGNNERRENEVPKSIYNQWLAQPIGANPEETGDTKNIPKDRLQDTGESEDSNKPADNENNGVLEEPLEYPETRGSQEKPNEKGKEEPARDSEKSEMSITYDERNRDNPGENERSNDGSPTSDERWKYDGIGGKTRSEDDKKLDDEELEGDRSARPYSEKVSRRHGSYENSARVEENNNAQGSPLDSFFRNNDDRQDELLENKSQSKETAEQAAASREARLIDESAEDSLPTMLDRSGPRNLAPGERTYSMIEPTSEEQCPPKTVGENSTSSSSGSNYLALKTTDDMFKGGIEQSNPADEKITEPEIMGKTTTEWKVINVPISNFDKKNNNNKNIDENQSNKFKLQVLSPHNQMEDEASAKPVTGRYLSSPLSAPSEDEGIIKPGSNLQYEFSEAGYEELGLNPRDVVHESIVDPEEMAADFDDDLMPRLGRSLQSVSHLIDPFGGIEETGDGERPADKYLEDTQIGFEGERESGRHRIRKREAGNLNKPSTIPLDDGDPELDEENRDAGTSIVSGGSDSDKDFAELNSRVNEAPNLTRINGNVDGVEKRSSEGETRSGHRSDGQEVDKSKRGLTNVEEWEMNPPDVQKQRVMTRSVEKSVDDLPKVGANVSGIESTHGLREDEKNGGNFKTEDRLSPDSDSHERETRSVKLRDANMKSYVSPYGTRNKKRSARSFPGNKMRSKTRRGAKFHVEFPSWGSISRDHRNQGSEKNGEYSAENYRDKKRNVYEKRSRSGSKKRKSYAEGTPVDERRSAQSSHSSSKRDEFSRPRHGNGKKTVRKSETNGKHSSRDVKKRRDGHRSKVTSSSEKAHPKRAKNHKERPRFEEVLREGQADGNRGMTANAAKRNLGSHDDSLQAPKAFDSGMQREGEGRVLDENAEDHGGNVGRTDDEAEKNDRKKKFKVLLAADNMEDESQMDLALHGELAGKIVERIFDQVQKNDALKVALGPGLFRKHKSEDAVESDKIYRQGLDEDEVKHTEAMMRRVMELLGRLVLDEVQRKTCASLPPDMRDFLQWMLGVEDEDRSSDQAPPLPPVHTQEPNHRQDDKFLFGGPIGRNENVDLDELNKKVRLLKGLIDEYSSLTSKEKTKVQSVHDYLMKQLELLLSYIDSKEAAGGKDEEVKLQGGNILQYQNPMSNSNGSVTSRPTLPPLANTPSILMLSNATFNNDHPFGSVIPYYSRSRRRYIRSSNHGVQKRAKKYNMKNKKHKSHKHKHKNKHKHNHGTPSGKQSPQYKKLIRKAALLRKKRAELYEDDWNPVDSGYEEPAIYTSSGELANGVGARQGAFSGDRKQSEEYDKLSNPYYWADVLSGKSNGDEEELDEKLSSHKRRAASKEFREETDQSNIQESNSSSNPMENGPINGETFSGQQVKRDVLSASVALQPWIDPKSNDLVSSEYLSELTDELVHGASVPPIYSAAHDAEEDNRGAGTRNSRESSKERNLAEQEVTLLSKREAWKAENEQQLEEVAFGKDMRGKWKEEERFKKLTELDKREPLNDEARRSKREDEVEVRSSGAPARSKKSACKAKAVDDRTKNGEGNVESDATAAPGQENAVVKGGADFGATGEEVNLISENLKNLNATFRSGNSIESSGISEALEELTSIPADKNPIGFTSDLAIGQQRKDEASNESSKVVSPLRNGESEAGEEAKEGDEGSKNGKDDRYREIGKVSRLLPPLEKMSKISHEVSGEKKTALRSRSASNIPIERWNAKKTSPLARDYTEGSAILPLLEVSEQRQQRKQASKAAKDDQRDIADQTLGLESPLTIGLNTY